MCHCAVTPPAPHPAERVVADGWIKASRVNNETIFKSHTLHVRFFDCAAFKTSCIIYHQLSRLQAEDYPAALNELMKQEAEELLGEPCGVNLL